MENAEQARSLFLAALMVGSVMVGVLYFDIEPDPGDLPPVISGDEPGQFEIGTLDSISVTISDENLDEIELDITLDGNRVTNYHVNEDGSFIVDISNLGAGAHSLKVIARDTLRQETRWFNEFTINYPPEGIAEIILDDFPTTIDYGDDVLLTGNLSHTSIISCEFVWSDGNIEESSLGMPMDEDGMFILGFNNLQDNLTIVMETTCGINIFTEASAVVDFIVNHPTTTPGCTDPEANNYDEAADEDDGSCTYDEPPVEGCMDSTATNYNENAEIDDGSCEYEEPPEDNSTGSQIWWAEVLLCDSTEQVEGIDDYNTTEFDNHICELSFTLNETHIQIDSNGLPNHDLESGPGCCASAQEDHQWTLPLEPTNQTGCDPSTSSDGCTLAPERGPVAVAVNGVPIFGPEDGPGGDAVANQEGEYEEDRQEVWLGICHAHSGPGGEYHYHADANCMHWHADEDNGETWANYSMESSRTVSNHSPIIGFAFDGYPIYGFVGWDEGGNTKEMTSSYKLKDGENGYNGIDDYEYVSGLGDLDACNGVYSPTPDYPEGIYHYHSTWVNGDGDLGFPYFIYCYRGVMEAGNSDGGQEGVGGDDDPCAGHGETWGPGIGPPPEDCDAGPPPGDGQGQSSEILPVISPWFKTPPNSGAIVISLLAMAVVAANGLRESAYPEVSRGPVGTAL